MVIRRFLAWRKKRRLIAHLEWLRANKVAMLVPDRSANRNSTEAVPN